MGTIVSVGGLLVLLMWEALEELLSSVGELLLVWENYCVVWENY